ncbi:glycosyltransferase [Selenomonas ruminantium]|uniref:glycosyltransferase n=1 Tax=Selenomonas ruminantium TaxID=971 RepID=UPI0026EB8CC7|nr:glycosyltransferase [Selenomonas ruminantium]
MINILYVIDSLKQRSGITSVVKNYLLNMHDDNIHVDLMTCNDSEQQIINIFLDNGNKVHYMPFLKMDNIYSYCCFWSNFFQHNKYDIVHSHFNQIDYIIFKIASQYGVKEFISHSHNTRMSDDLWKAARNFIMCYPARHVATRWGACSEAAGKALFGKDFLKSNKKLLIHNAIDVNKFKYDDVIRNKIRKKLGVSGKFVMGNIGRFKYQKNKMFLLEVLAKVREYNKNVILLNLGDGEERKPFEKKMNDMGLRDCVILTGTVNNPEEYLQAMDVFVLPSIYEGLPVVGIEAQTSGLPCVFSENITNEINLLDSNEVVSLKAPLEEWSRAILKYENFPREDKSCEIQKRGYDIRKEADKLALYYHEIIGDTL